MTGLPFEDSPNNRTSGRENMTKRSRQDVRETNGSIPQQDSNDRTAIVGHNYKQPRRDNHGGGATNRTTDMTAMT